MTDAPPAEPAPAPAPAQAAASAPAKPSRQERRAKWWDETKTDLKWATALLFVLILAIAGYSWTAWRGVTAGEEDLAEVTRSIFALDGLVVPFELLSVLLLAALVAGVVIAFRDPEDEI